MGHNSIGMPKTPNLIHEREIHPRLGVQVKNI
jgi:hypothetical protein